MSLTEIDQFLEIVKKTFSDVLFPIEYIDKQDFLGKGKFILGICTMILNTYVGAFGVVHKGAFVDSDGSMMPIAIKTIKCKFSTIICIRNNY